MNSPTRLAVRADLLTTRIVGKASDPVPRSLVGLDDKLHQETQARSHDSSGN